MREAGGMSFSESGRQALHDAMAARVAAGELPGLVTLLAKDDTVDVDLIGSADLENTAPMRRDTLFRLASITKPMVAAVAMMLVDDGTLGLAEPVQTWLPELADRRVLQRIDGPLDETVPAERAITVEDLLTFRMGYGMITEPSFNPPYPVNLKANELELRLGPPVPRTLHGPDEWLRRFASLPLMDQPGTRWRYNVSAHVLGVLVARAGGAPLGQVMRERLFDPLGLVDTGFSTTPANTARMTPQFMSDMRGGPVTAQPLSTPDIWTAEPVFPDGAAGLLSTVDEVLTFARLLANGGMHHNRRLLKAESVAAMTTNHLTPDQLAGGGFVLGGEGWGYGMSVHVNDAPGRYGWDGGTGTTWRTDPATGLIAIALSQTSDFLFNGGRDDFLRLAQATLR
jgi:CubicO group peptidase (beta-lactamase class C family)